MDVRGSRVVRSFQHSGRRARLDVGATLLALVVALTSQAAVAGQLQLTWVDNSGGQAAFNVQRRVSTDTGYIDLVQQPPGVTGYTDGTVTAGITYCYRVQAYDDAGSSPYSNEACGDTASGLAVTVSVGGTGQGTVTSNPTGISCGTDCVETYSSGTVVTVSATAVSGSTFGGWSGGGCTGTAPCTFTGNAPVTVGATFTAASPPTAQTQSVVSLTLINADTDAPIPGYDPLPNGATLNLATLPTRRLNIRANTSPSTVGSVRFGYDSNANYRIENWNPYALAGDSAGYNYTAWTPSLGTHSVTATPYTQAYAGGTRGTTKTQSFTVVDQTTLSPTVAPSSSGGTQVSIVGSRFYINGRVTYPGADAEGLLMNVRMVNAVFEDTKLTSFDPEANTDEFLAVVPEYVGAGVRAFTVSLQGGNPSYEGAVNSAFTSSGAPRTPWSTWPSG